jgi:hypothetical protein
MFPDSACLSSMRAFPHLFVLAITCGSLLSACDRSVEQQVPPLDQTDELVVITINSPDTYYENADGVYAGLEFDLASEFARDAGKKIRFKVMQTWMRRCSRWRIVEGTLPLVLSSATSSGCGCVSVPSISPYSRRSPTTRTT